MESKTIVRGFAWTTWAAGTIFSGGKLAPAPPSG